MASTNLTLYTDTTTSETWNLYGVVGNETRYISAASTPTFPVGMELTSEVKPVGNMTNDRHRINLHRSGAKTAQGAVGTAGTELKISVPKDPTSASTLVADTVASLSCLVSYLTGAAPTATCYARLQALAVGQWV